MWFGRELGVPTTVLAWSQVSTMDAFDADSNAQNDDSDDDDNDDDDDKMTRLP